MQARDRRKALALKDTKPAVESKGQVTTWRTLYYLSQPTLMWKRLTLQTQDKYSGAHL